MALVTEGGYDLDALATRSTPSIDVLAGDVLAPRVAGERDRVDLAAAPSANAGQHGRSRPFCEAP